MAFFLLTCISYWFNISIRSKHTDNRRNADFRFVNWIFLHAQNSLGLFKSLKNNKSFQYLHSADSVWNFAKLGYPSMRWTVLNPWRSIYRELLRVLHSQRPKLFDEKVERHSPRSQQNKNAFSKYVVHRLGTFSLWPILKPSYETRSSKKLLSFSRRAESEFITWIRWQSFRCSVPSSRIPIRSLA